MGLLLFLFYWNSWCFCFLIFTSIRCCKKKTFWSLTIKDAVKSWHFVLLIPPFSSYMFHEMESYLLARCSYFPFMDATILFPLCGTARVICNVTYTCFFLSLLSNQCFVIISVEILLIVFLMFQFLHFLLHTVASVQSGQLLILQILLFVLDRVKVT